MLSTRLKLQWASGAFGVAVLMNGISALAMFYFTVVLRMEPALAGLLIFVSRIYDAVTDPLSGWLSDRTNSSLGRRRPYLLGGAFISAFSFVILFNVPLAQPGVWMTTWVMVSLLIFTSGYSMFNVPYMAMPAEMTQDFHERTSIHGYRVFMAALGGLAVQFLAGNLLESVGKDRSGYSMVGWIGAMLILLSMLIAFFGTAKAPAPVKSLNSLPFMEQVRAFGRNRPFQLIMGVKLAQLIGLSASTGGLIFFFARVIDQPLTILGPFGLATTVAVLVSAPALLGISKYIGKRGGYAVAAAITGLASLSWMFAQPGEPLWLLLLRGFFLGVAFAGNVMFAMSMLTDAMEIDWHRTGMRREGMYSALYSFVEKLAMSVGPLILGGALSLAGFNPDSPPSEVTPQVRQAVLLGIAYVPAAMALVAVSILSFYRLDQQALAESRATRVLP
ncbi:MAG TPA: glycoside-pentoside-hexuronide (GPH):cation symporter [Steroidobacteraceae bacterium]|nr:glycoside-pentoside-hexuronide (GPH):cation symporter [Steroidobacteraceae bacterium]HRX90558.1 glycoside-pentoside-hexuronide (GPH):cation symporter [Steroidobacteraceae bacterium]